MNENRARYNFYLYKWQPDIAERVRSGDRVTVSIRDFGSEEAQQEIRALREAGVEVYGAVPVLWRPGQGPLPEEVAAEVDGWYAGNLGQIRRLLDTGRPVMGDAGLNVFNQETAEAFRAMGLSGVTWSYELEVIPRRQKQACDLPEGQSRTPVHWDWQAEGEDRADVPLRESPERERPRGKCTGSVKQREWDEGSFKQQGSLPGKTQTDFGQQGLLGEGLSHSSLPACHPEGSEGSAPISSLPSPIANLPSSRSHRPSPFTFEVLRRGRVPAMVSEYCPLAGAEGIKGSRCGRCSQENPVWLKDFKGERYPVLLDPENCTSLILSRQVLDRPEAEEWAKEGGEQVIQRVCVFD